MAKPNNIEIGCYHCGEHVEENKALHYDDKNFCCEGCKLVYGILNENGLCNYYTIDQNPGITQKNINLGKFEYLSLPEVEEKILAFKSKQLNKVDLYVPDIHCSSCIWLLENLQKLNSGINSSRVDFVQKRVQVSYNTNLITLKEVVILLTKIGYEPNINLKDTEKTTKKSDNELYLKLGVAGFCFGNIMLLSFPEYFSLEDSEFKQFFGYLNILLALPVLLYSSTVYLKPAYKAFFTKQINIDVPIAIGIFALFFTSVFEIVTGIGSGYLDSFGGLLFFLLLGKVFQHKTYSFLSFERDFKSYFPVSVNKIINEQEQPTLVNLLKKDDRIVIRNNELIPVDAVVTKGKAFVDYSFITGESAPILVQENEKVFAGGKQVGGTVELSVLKEFSNSDITKLWDNAVFKEENASEFDQLTTRLSKYFTIAIMFISVGAALYWLPTQPNIALKAFTSVLIIACPCALALASPFTWGNVIRIMGKHKFFLKNALVAEKMASVNTVVFDKTGTLTKNEKGNIVYEGIEITNDQKVLFYSLAKQSNHPISRQIAQYLDSKELDLDEVIEVEGKGIKGSLKGVEVRIGSAKFVAYNDYLAPFYGAFLSFNGKVLGRVIMASAYRKNSESVIKELKNTADLYILSGDNNKDEQYLSQWFSKHALKFNQSPEDKLYFVQNLQKDGDKVLMIGDGLNDAGALKAAEVGIALNENVSSFSPACSAILEAESFDKLPNFIAFSNKAQRIVKMSFRVSFMYNVVGVSFAVQGLLTPVISAILMPLSSISVVLFTTLAVNFAAKKSKLL